MENIAENLVDFFIEFFVEKLKVNGARIATRSRLESE